MAVGGGGGGGGNEEVVEVEVEDVEF